MLCQRLCFVCLLRQVYSLTLRRSALKAKVCRQLHKVHQSADHCVDDISYEVVEDAIVLFDIPSDTTVSLSVAHSDASAFHAMVSGELDLLFTPLTLVVEGEHTCRLCDIS